MGLALKPRIERGSVLDIPPRLIEEIPADRPLLVTDSYATLFMSEDDRETFRSLLDQATRTQRVVWISHNTLAPAGPQPTHTTAGTIIPKKLFNRNRLELFGVVCITTWKNGRRKVRIAALTHPGAC